MWRRIRCITKTPKIKATACSLRKTERIKEKDISIWIGWGRWLRGNQKEIWKRERKRKEKAIKINWSRGDRGWVIRKWS